MLTKCTFYMLSIFHRIREKRVGLVIIWHCKLVTFYIFLVHRDVNIFSCSTKLLRCSKPVYYLFIFIALVYTSEMDSVLCVITRLLILKIELILIVAILKVQEWRDVFLALKKPDSWVCAVLYFVYKHYCIVAELHVWLLLHGLLNVYKKCRSVEDFSCKISTLETIIINHNGKHVYNSVLTFFYICKLKCS